MAKKSTLQVKGTTIRTLQHNGIDYICIILPSLKTW